MFSHLKFEGPIAAGLRVAVTTIAYTAVSGGAAYANDTPQSPASGGIPTFQLFLQIGTVLVVIIILIVGATWLLRGIGRFNRSADGVLSVVSVLPLGTRERIVLLQAGRRQLLIGVAPGRVSTLHIFDEAVESEIQDRDRESPAGPFAALVSRLLVHRAERQSAAGANNG